MVGSRFLTSTIRCYRGSLTSSSSVPAMSFPMVKPMPLATSSMNLINKRSFQSGTDNDSWSSWTSKLFTGFGVLLGIGCGAAYTAHHAMKDRDFILTNYDLVVSCAPKDKCAKRGSDADDEEDECIPKKCGETRCLRDVECEEELIKNANNDLERALKDTRTQAITYAESAMQAYCDAQPLICEFLNLGYGTIANDDLQSPEYEATWSYLYDLAKRRCEKVTDAVEKGMCAWELLSRLRSEIEKGRACRYTSCNPLLVTAEESLLCAERDLLNAKAKMEWTQSEHDMVDQYEDVIAIFKKELKQDINSRIAAKEPPYCEIKYPEQERAMMILHAYTKAVRAQREVAQVLVCSGRIPSRLTDTCC